MNKLFKDLFVFEMANNHQGSVEHGLRIIDALGKIAQKHKINAGVKFQYRHLDTFIHPEFRSRTDVNHIPRFLSTRLNDREFRVLLAAVRDQGMITICTPFDERSVAAILDHGVQIIKVASCSADDWPLLEEIARAQKPVICSTGGRSLYEIDNLVSFFYHRNLDFSLMHCVALYPTPDSSFHLNFIDRMKRRYRHMPIGYSGHEAPDNLDVVKIAVAKGATILERHVGLEADTISLNSYSMNPEQADAWVESALRASEICGNGNEKAVTQDETESLLSLARGVYALRDIEEGQGISRDEVFFAMPCAKGQTTSGEYQDTITASRNYRANEPIYERRPANMITTVRGVIHDAKGLLAEAGIEIGSDFEIELSHHYGMEHFRQTGVVMINLINRAYCKKLLVLLSGQNHPSHYHKIKEETFHVLWGDLEATLNSKSTQLKAGDKVLIERGMGHSFKTQGGCIFEEISTTHMKGDSYYEDEDINSIDPILRKTIIEDW